MTRTIKAITFATGLLSLIGVLGQAVPAQADPPSHAPAWGYRNKQDKKDKKGDSRWQSRRDDRPESTNSRRWSSSRRWDNDRDNNRSDWRRDSNRDSNRSDWRRDNDRDRNRDNQTNYRNRDSDRDGIRDIADRYPTNARRH